jgi:hypothetical protein
VRYNTFVISGCNSACTLRRLGLRINVLRYRTNSQIVYINVLISEDKARVLKYVGVR